MKRARHVKIVATLGPSSEGYDMIRKLYEAGADVFRLNMSHGGHDEIRARHAAIRQVEKDVGRPIAILADLQGPKLRVDVFANGAAELEDGQDFRLDLDPTPGDQSDLVMLSGSAYSDPEFTYVDTNAVTGIIFLDGTIFGPAYDDGVLVVNNNLSTMHLFRLNDARTAFELSGNLADLEADDNAEAAALEVGSEFGAPTDLVVGPDGAIYVVAIGDGAVYRIVPEPAGLAVLALGGLALMRRKRR